MLETAAKLGKGVGLRGIDFECVCGANNFGAGIELTAAARTVKIGIRSAVFFGGESSGASFKTANRVSQAVF